MGIVYHLPLKQWYHDETSEWTLDYPPLFAFFEFLLALVAGFLGLEEDLELTKNPIRTELIIIYQKITVILSDFIYYYSIYRLSNLIETRTLSPEKQNSSKDKQLVTRSKQNLADAFYKPDITSRITILMIFNPCLLLIDHIHFQYNGFLSGILFLSVSYIIEEKYLLASFWFAILLNLKHIYLYCAPSYGLYLLCVYCLTCFRDNTKFVIKIVNCIRNALSLGLIVTLVLLMSLSPFVRDIESLKQITSRLFPFKRGLTHAYWAPNFWSLYNLMDKVLSQLLLPPPVAKFDMDSISGIKQADNLLSSTSGLVQEYEHRYLPSIKPNVTFVLVGLFTVPLAIKHLMNYQKKSHMIFLKSLVITSLTSFMFGWHVHEKAILLTLLPLIPVAMTQKSLYNPFARLSLLATYSILPLLFERPEYLIKMAIFISYSCYVSSNRPKSSHNHHKKDPSSSIFKGISSTLYHLIDFMLIAAVIVIEIYNSFIFGSFNCGWNPIARLNKLAFLPLLLTSVISATGISFTYFELYYDFLTSSMVEIE